MPVQDNRKRRQHCHSERGTQIVELALVLPVLVIFTFLVTEGAALVRIHQVLVNAARETARVAILPENRADLNNMVENTGTCYAIRNRVTINQSVVCGGQTITPPLSPTCSTYAMSVSGYNGVPPIAPILKSDGMTYMTITQVKISCGHRFMWGSHLGGIGFHVPDTVTLSSAVDFRNF